jgi:uncharacterized protein YbjT (DUF2867 family)
MRVLVTGGAGHLGRQVVRAAIAAGHAVRIASRKAQPAVAIAATDPLVAGESAQLDLATGAGLPEALAVIDPVVRAASDPRRSKATDVEGTRTLIEAAGRAGISHLLFVSIVGVDKHPLTHYQHELQTERDPAASGLPHSILRATHFHWFVDYLLGQAARTPIVTLLPAGFHVPSVGESEVAGRILSVFEQALRSHQRG